MNYYKHKIFKGISFILFFCLSFGVAGWVEASSVKNEPTPKKTKLNPTTTCTLRIPTESQKQRQKTLLLQVPLLISNGDFKGAQSTLNLLKESKDPEISEYIQQLECFLIEQHRNVQNQQLQQIYNKAMESKDVKSLNKLGFLFFRGERVPKNLKAAFECFFVATKWDYPLSGYNLGMMYEWGDATEKNIGAALFLYTWSASHKVRRAQEPLLDYFPHPSSKLIRKTPGASRGHPYTKEEYMKAIEEFEKNFSRHSVVGNLFPPPIINLQNSLSLCVDALKNESDLKNKNFLVPVKISADQEPHFYPNGQDEGGKIWQAYTVKGGHYVSFGMNNVTKFDQFLKFEKEWEKSEDTPPSCGDLSTLSPEVKNVKTMIFTFYDLLERGGSVRLARYRARYLKEMGGDIQGDGE